METKKVKEIDWEQRRYEIAKDILATVAVSVNASPDEWMKGMSYKKASAILAIRYADALIIELKKANGTEENQDTAPITEEEVV